MAPGVDSALSRNEYQEYLIGGGSGRRVGQKILPTTCADFDVLLTVHLSIFISVINQLDAQNVCCTVSLFHASTCFEHMCSSSGLHYTASGIITPIGVMIPEAV